MTNTTPTWVRRGLSTAAAVAALTAAVPAAAGAATPQFTPLTTTVVAPPEAVVGSDGRTHLVYEIAVQNRFPDQLEIVSLAVRAHGRTLQVRRGEQLAGAIWTASSATNSLAGGEGATVWLDVTVPARHVPRTLTHRLTVRSTTGEPHSYTYEGAPTVVHAHHGTAVAPPLHGGPFLNFN